MIAFLETTAGATPAVVSFWFHLGEYEKAHA
jgi:hypothetical protein